MKGSALISNAPERAGIKTRWRRKWSAWHYKGSFRGAVFSFLLSCGRIGQYSSGSRCLPTRWIDEPALAMVPLEERKERIKKYHKMR